MTTTEWASLSRNTFTVALLAYVVAMVAYFHYLAFRKRPVWIAARTIAWAGLATHVVSIASRGIAAGRVPWVHMYEDSSLLSPLVATRRNILPPSETLDRLAYKTIAFAFPIWTFAVIAGAIWAESAWGRYWGWDPKETWSFITWVVFAGYLHARATAGWRGRRAAVIALIGFASLLVTYYVVNLWIVGLHSYKGF